MGAGGGGLGGVLFYAVVSYVSQRCDDGQRLCLD